MAAATWVRRDALLSAGEVVEKHPVAEVSADSCTANSCPHGGVMWSNTRLCQWPRYTAVFPQSRPAGARSAPDSVSWLDTSSLSQRMAKDRHVLLQNWLVLYERFQRRQAARKSLESVVFSFQDALVRRLFSKWREKVDVQRRNRERTHVIVRRHILRALWRRWWRDHVWRRLVAKANALGRRIRQRRSLLAWRSTVLVRRKLSNLFQRVVAARDVHLQRKVVRAWSGTLMEQNLIRQYYRHRLCRKLMDRWKFLARNTVAKKQHAQWHYVAMCLAKCLLAWRVYIAQQREQRVRRLAADIFLQRRLLSTSWCQWVAFIQSERARAIEVAHQHAKLRIAWQRAVEFWQVRTLSAHFAMWVEESRTIRILRLFHIYRQRERVKSAWKCWRLFSRANWFWRTRTAVRLLRGHFHSWLGTVAAGRLRRAALEKDIDVLHGEWARRRMLVHFAAWQRGVVVLQGKRVHAALSEIFLPKLRIRRAWLHWQKVWEGHLIHAAYERILTLHNAVRNQRLLSCVFYSWCDLMKRDIRISMQLANQYADSVRLRRWFRHWISAIWTARRSREFLRPYLVRWRRGCLVIPRLQNDLAVLHERKTLCRRSFVDWRRWTLFQRYHRHKLMGVAEEAEKRRGLTRWVLVWREQTRVRQLWRFSRVVRLSIWLHRWHYALEVRQVERFADRVHRFFVLRRHWFGWASHVRHERDMKREFHRLLDLSDVTRLEQEFEDHDHL